MNNPDIIYLPCFSYHDKYLCISYVVTVVQIIGRNQHVQVGQGSLLQITIQWLKNASFTTMEIIVDNNMLLGKTLCFSL